MGTFRVTVEVGDPGGQRFVPVEALVDTGSTYTALPASFLRDLGVSPHDRGVFELADGRRVEREVGRTWVRIQGRAEMVPVVFAEEGSTPLLGAVTLEVFRLAPDPVRRRLIPVPGLLMAGEAWGRRATPHLILTGFAGTGKTAVGRECARLLGWPFLDTDEEVVRRAGKPIHRIFQEEGEPAFRHLEAEVIAGACARRDPTVIAVGGGAVVDEKNRDLLLRSGVVLCLEARPETIHQRLFTGEKGVVRPLLQAPDPLSRIRGLKAQRQPSYALAHWTVHTDGLSVEECAREALRAFSLLSPRLFPGAGLGDMAGLVVTQGGVCPLYIGWGLLDTLGERCQRAGLDTVAFLFSDENVFYKHGRHAQRSLEEAGIPVHCFVIPPGEASKTVETAEHAWRWLADLRAGRDHFIVAVGGGVVGDLAGFIAATYNRGMPVVQVPTSLSAMVDASIGGKTGVDLPQGKNLVGAFHQPRFVLADLEALRTLLPRELASGWAEAIKHALIRDASLFDLLEEHAEAVQALEPDITLQAVRRSMAIKAEIVSQDERETLGLRLLLNYGHTLGHALETATGYTHFLHGEAVSIGMTAAAHISWRMGLLPGEEKERQGRLLRRFRLPTSCPGVDRERVRRAIGVDKKRARGALRWVLLEGIGRAVVRSDVPPDLVEEALARVCEREG